VQQTRVAPRRSQLTLRLDVPPKRSTSRILRPTSRIESRARRRLNPSCHRSARLVRSPSKLLVHATARPESPRIPRARQPRPRPPGSDSVMRPRSSPACPLPVVTTHIRAAALQPCQSTRVLEMPSFAAHRLLGTPPSPPVPPNTTTALVASPRFRPHARAIAASTRPSNPACSGLRFATLARR